MQDTNKLPPKTWWLCKETIDDSYQKQPVVIVRPCPLSYNEVLSSLTKKVIPLYGARYVAKDNETLEQFEIRLAAEDGINVDFVLEDVFDDFISHTCIKSSLVDSNTGKTLYKYVKQ